MQEKFSSKAETQGISILIESLMSTQKYEI